MGDVSAEDLALWEGSDIKSCDDAEVVAAAFEGAEEVGRGGFIDVGEGSGGKDNLRG